MLPFGGMVRLLRGLAQHVNKKIGEKLFWPDLESFLLEGKVGNSVPHVVWKEIPKQAATRSGRWRLLAFGEMGEFGPRPPAGCPIADKPFVSVILTSMARRLAHAKGCVAGPRVLVSRVEGRESPRRAGLPVLATSIPAV